MLHEYMRESLNKYGVGNISIVRRPTPVLVPGYGVAMPGERVQKRASESSMRRQASDLTSAKAYVFVIRQHARLYTTTY